jgi:hypothetical protein
VTAISMATSVRQASASASYCRSIRVEPWPARPRTGPLTAALKNPCDFNVRYEPPPRR